jgi:CheY-like chemotaxis protein
MDDMPPKRRENVQHILKGGRHLLDLINEVLDISRIEVGHLALSLEPVPVDSTVREVLDLVRPLTAVGNVQLINEIPPHNDWCMLADRQRLKQVLLNLASNAIKYNRDGGSVTILAEKISGEATSARAGEQRAGEQRGVLRLSIRDTGNGLSGEDIGKLFVPFERLGAARTRIEGTGIGLVLSKRLVEAMGGHIGVSSTPGQGSTFWIELPLVPNPLQTAQKQPETSTLQTMIMPGGAPKTVLYIEDNLANLRLVETLLEARPNIRLLTAMQGSTGLDFAFEHSPDLILLDLHLPDINGDEVLRRLQANAATRSTPVVMISADATPGQIDRLLAAGAKTYLTKPLNVKEFLSVLDDSPEGNE